MKMVVGSNPNHNTVLKEVVLSRENDQVSVLKSVKAMFSREIGHFYSQKQG